MTQKEYAPPLPFQHLTKAPELPSMMRQPTGWE